MTIHTYYIHSIVFITTAVDALSPEGRAERLGEML